MALALCLCIIACSKSDYQITDPETGLPAVPLTTSKGECYLTKITQKNRSATKNDNAFQIYRNTGFDPQKLYQYDSITNKVDYDIQVTRVGDTLKLSTGQYFIIDATSKLVKYFVTKDDISDPTSDDYLYQYEYNGAGYLVKKLAYINGSVTPFYESNYNYDNNNLLISCVMYAGPQKSKLLDAAIAYDMTAAKKPWIYLFPDFFEGYNYLQSFNFGKKGTYPVKSIVTKVYDINGGAVLDTWNTNFGSYVFSTDDFILQTTAQGDLQQGLGFLFGITRFTYQCSE